MNNECDNCPFSFPPSTILPPWPEHILFTYYYLITSPSLFWSLLHNYIHSMFTISAFVEVSPFILCWKQLILQESSLREPVCVVLIPCRVFNVALREVLLLDENQTHREAVVVLAVLKVKKKTRGEVLRILRK